MKPDLLRGSRQVFSSLCVPRLLDAWQDFGPPYGFGLERFPGFEVAARAIGLDLIRGASNTEGDVRDRDGEIATLVAGTKRVEDRRGMHPEGFGMLKRRNLGDLGNLI